jgi:hypothetical protein
MEEIPPQVLTAARRPAEVTEAAWGIRCLKLNLSLKGHGSASSGDAASEAATMNSSSPGGCPVWTPQFTASGDAAGDHEFLHSAWVRLVLMEKL